MINSKIISTGSYLPELIITNDDMSKIIDTSHEWIKSRTGISERRISTNKDTSDLAYEASLNALRDTKYLAKDIDLIIVATVTPDMHMPSTACLLQKKLDAYNATAFDVTAACTGFVYALTIADAMIKTGQYKLALIIGAETLSKVINWEDRSTAVLFGDGAGAVLLEAATEEKGILSTYTKSKGKDGQVLTIGNGRLKNPYSDNDLKEKDHYIEMEGNGVFRFAIDAMQESILKVIGDSNENLENIDWIIPHQANERIIDFVDKKLDIDGNKFYKNLDVFGNTSSASIPIALDEMNKKGLLKDGNKIVLVGFGGGLTYGATLIQWINNK